MLTYQCLKCGELEIRVNDVNHVNDVSFIELRAHEIYGNYGKWRRQCLWKACKTEIDGTFLTTEMWWTLHMTETGEASDRRKKTEKA